jgi:hypothetical protein
MRGVLKTVTLLSAGVWLSLWGGTAQALEPDGTIAIRLPRGVQLHDVALAATGSINLGDRSIVSGPSLGVGTVANTGPGGTQVGVTTNVGTNTISAPAVFLANYARLGGSLLTTVTPTLQLGAKIAGGVTTNAQLTPVGVVDWRPPAGGAGNDFTLAPDATGTISAGAFRNVTIYSRAKITFGPGVYEMQSFDLEPQATVTFDNRSGPIILYVGSSLIARGTVQLLGSSNSFAIIYEGTNGIALETPISGAVVAPYAQLRLAAMGTKQFSGQFVGQSLVVDPDVHVSYAAFNWDAIRPLLGSGTAVAGTIPSPPNPTTQKACFAPSFTGSTTTSSNGEVVYSALHYKAIDVPNGVCAPTFCDADGNPVPGPTDAQLNSPPPAGSTCPSVGPVDHCPVDSSTLTTACTSDADCGAGGICASQCVDAGCTTIRHLCGKPAATCATLPSEGLCDEFRLCPDPGATGAANLDKLLSELAPTTAPDPSGLISPTPPAPPIPYAAVADARCTGAAIAPVTLSDGSSKPGSDGSSDWGINITPVTAFNVTPVKRVDGIADLSIDASGSLTASATMFGDTVSIFNASAEAAVDDCGVKLVGSVTFFGDQIATFLGDDGASGLSSQAGVGLVTPGHDACSNLKKQAETAIGFARDVGLEARFLPSYYNKFGLTQDLCGALMGESAVVAAIGHVDCSNLANLPQSTASALVNGFATAYAQQTAAYVSSANQLLAARQANQTSGQIELFDDPHAYDVTIFDQDFPLGPVTLELAVEGFGSWDLQGGLQFGVAPGGGLGRAVGILSGDASQGTADLTAYAGPVFTPDLAVGVLAYVGIGLPGVTVGLQGQIDLLDVKLPTAVVAAASHVSLPDPRSVSGTEYAGTLIPGMEPKLYQWVTGYDWGSSLQLTELSGEMDLAARVHILFFKHTFRKKLFSWAGITHTFPLVGGSSNPTASPGNVGQAGDYGKQNDVMAFTTPVPVTPGPINIQLTGSQYDCQAPPK